MQLENGEKLRLEIGASLTLEQIKILVGQINLEQNILIDRVNVANFQNLVRQKLISIVYNFKGEIIANGVLWPTLGIGIWYELGSCWVRKDYRKMHIGTELFRKIINNKPLNSNLFLASSNSVIWQIANDLAFVEKDKNSFKKCQIKPYFSDSEKLFVLENRVKN